MSPVGLDRTCDLAMKATPPARSSLPPLKESGGTCSDFAGLSVYDGGIAFLRRVFLHRI
jgi:hypothetical protein